jgi:hypothetical protein
MKCTGSWTCLARSSAIASRRRHPIGSLRLLLGSLLVVSVLVALVGAASASAGAQRAAYWEWNRARAITAVSSVDWSTAEGYQSPHYVSCKGIWNGGAKHYSDGWFFSDFRCEFWQRADGWSVFKLHVTGKQSSYRTSDWRAGRIGSSSSGSNGGTSDSPGCSTRGVTLSLTGVGCNVAISVYSTYASTGAAPSGWSCAPRQCGGPADYTGLRVHFSW